MDVNGRPNATLGPCDVVSKPTYIEKGLDASVDVGLYGVDGLVPSIEDY
jgi:hypothetical protein